MFGVSDESFDGRRYVQLSEAVQSHTRDLIISGELPVGSFIRLDRLAEELNISVTPVREGLLRLRGSGLVELAPRRGFVVAPFDPDDIRDLFVAQGLLAGELAKRATSRFTDADVDELAEHHEALKAAALDRRVADVEGHNHRFHRKINTGAGAPKIATLLRMGTQYVPTHFFSSQPDWVDASIREHEKILWGLREREPELVRVKMNDHIIHAGELLAAHLAEQRLRDADRLDQIATK